MKQYRKHINRIFLKQLAFLCMLVSGFASTGNSFHSFHNEHHPGLEPILYLSESVTNSAYTSGQDNDHITLPLKRAGNLILLEAIVDGIRGNLIFDTGSAVLVLNSMYFSGGGRLLASQVAGGITGSTGTVETLRIDTMQISGMEFNRLNASLSDLAHIEAARNIRILGFFGLTLFRDYEVVIDLENNILELFRLNFRGNRINRDSPSPRFDIQMPVTVDSDVVFLEASINNSRLLFCLDTGAENNILASTLPSRVLNSVTIKRRSTLRGAGSQQIEVLHGIMNQLTIEGTAINGMEVLITNLNTMSNFFGKRISGMLGCEFLEKGVFYINIKRQTLGIVFH